MNAYIIHSGLNPDEIIYAQDQHQALEKYAYEWGYASASELKDSININIRRIQQPNRHHKTLHTGWKHPKDVT